MIRSIFTPLALLLAAGSSSAGPDIRTDDVSRFYALYDATGGKPSVEQIQNDYLDKASPGLTEFSRVRNITADRIATALAEKPALFAKARDCVGVLPGVKRRLAVSLAKLGTIYPKAVFPSVSIVIGRGRTGGTAFRNFVAIGLESVCSYDMLSPNLEDRFVHLIAHEYVHVQQPAAQIEDPAATLLEAALIEGIAEFVGERISGSTSMTHLQRFTTGHEREIETAFVADMDKRATDTQWMYDQSVPVERRDLGYWVGYRIARAYYQNAKDKRAAIAAIIDMSDPKAFLAKSGWRPGIKL